MIKEVLIRQARQADAAHLVNVICQANNVVAKQFGITFDNNPKHPSFYTEAWLMNDFTRGEQYFVAEIDGGVSGSDGSDMVACVAFEHPRPDTAYLNRLSVLPHYQKQGIGCELVEHIIHYARNKNITFISIGIIASHTELKNWYIRMGFIEGDTKTMAHLPFDVTYLRLTL